MGEEKVDGERCLGEVCICNGSLEMGLRMLVRVMGGREVGWIRAVIFL